MSIFVKKSEDVVGEINTAVRPSVVDKIDENNVIEAISNADTQDTEILGLQLKLTCFACPEQYNVFLGAAQVGYLRLRHGYFRADVPDVGGTTVYIASNVKGDGMFEDDERAFFLHNACRSIWKAIISGQVAADAELLNVPLTEEELEYCENYICATPHCLNAATRGLSLCNDCFNGRPDRLAAKELLLKARWNIMTKQKEA